MASYIVFVPDAKNETETRAAMSEVGLGDLLDGAQCMHVTGHGPNDGHGHLVHWSCPNHFERDCKLVVDPDVIDWTESKAPGLFWMGQEHERPVCPEDIQQQNQNGDVPHPGELVRLGDLQQWEIPHARQLPMRPTLDENREPDLVVVDRYRALYEQAEKYLQEVMSIDTEDPGRLQFKDAFRFAVQALSINYRVNLDVADWLGLFATESDLFSVCAATIELNAIIEAQKKTLTS